MAKLLIKVSIVQLYKLYLRYNSVEIFKKHCSLIRVSVGAQNYYTDFNGFLMIFFSSWTIS